MDTFRRDWRGWIESSDGYSVRLMGRNRLQYRDAHCKLAIFAEPMSKPWSNIVVDVASIPDRPELSRAEVIRRLRRAFDFAGWRLLETGGDNSGDV